MEVIVGGSKWERGVDSKWKRGVGSGGGGVRQECYSQDYIL